ncbi:SCP2 sterol-binding domain-containing protein [Algoriphagus sp.]|uniref:SCP2 sterol-binding domain-containing protein n=1 Tax=Algoriphagus sp. TaxID=1872435 RepID=UPI0025DA7CB2|nr:SCP2 sterol-binding domain-containing protein [Algoriphagus sp.]
MADKPTLQKRLDRMVNLLNRIGPDVADYWGGSILFKTPDLNTGWFLQMSMDGTVESLVEKVDEEAATCIIEADSDVILGVFNAVIDPMAAVNDGRMLVHKSVEPIMMIMPAVIEAVEK